MRNADITWDEKNLEQLKLRAFHRGKAGVKSDVWVLNRAKELPAVVHGALHVITQITSRHYFAAAVDCVGEVSNLSSVL